MSKDKREKIAVYLWAIVSSFAHTFQGKEYRDWDKLPQEGKELVYPVADQIIALFHGKPTWTESVGWLIDRSWVPPDQYKINIEEIEAKARLTVQTELALERDIIKQINEAKIEEAKDEERERIDNWFAFNMPLKYLELFGEYLKQALKGDKQMKLKCKKCNWIGFQEECPVITEPSPLLEEDAEPYPVCPDCKGTILVPLGNEIQLDT